VENAKLRYFTFESELLPTPEGAAIKIQKGKDSGGGVLISVIGEAEYSSYRKEAGTKTRQRDIEAVGNRATGRNHY
jgi:hypothetical protein